MIPTNYIVALVFTGILLFSQLLDIPGKYKNFFIRVGLASITSVCWVNIIIANFTISQQWLHVVLSILFGGTAGAILTIFTWKDPLINENSVAQINYTTETLIGANGVVLSVYGEGSFLCKLRDSAETQIVVYLEDCNINDKFIIEKIENGKIFGRKL